MAHHDVRLPLEIERDLRGGTTFSTTVVTSTSGVEQRTAERSRARRQYELTVAGYTREKLDQLRAFFLARQGRLHTFRLRDPLDWWVGMQPVAGVGLEVSTPQTLGTGNGTRTTWQLFKRYTDTGGYNTDRDLTLPVVASVRIYVGGTELTSGWSCSASGLVTFSSAPANAAAIAFACQFDTRVRFDQDDEQLSATNWNSARQTVRLVEVLG
jgi:uncharacterized protein (TIGR02217 family)